MSKLTINVFIAYQFKNAKVKKSVRERAIRTAVERVRKDLTPTAPGVSINLQTFDLKPVENVFRQIKDMIERASIFVADISELNPNVIFELGYAFGVSTTSAKKLVILCHDSVDVKQLPSDLSGMFVIKYAKTKFQEVLQKELQRAAETYIEAVKTGELDDIGVKAFWRYHDGQDIDIVCSEIPPTDLPEFAQPNDRNYLHYARFADLDSLFHIRSNLPRLFPRMRMRDFPASEHRNTEYNGLIVLGGPAWNQRSKALQFNLPLHFEDRKEEPDDVLVVVGANGKDREFKPSTNSDGKIVSDISVVCRMSDVSGRTTFLFAGSLTFGVLGACKAFLNKACGVVNSQFIAEKIKDDDFISVFESQCVEQEVTAPRFDVKDPFYLFSRKPNQGGSFQCVYESTA